MNKNLVTSLELSEKLQELGIRQESEFYWIKGKRKFSLTNKITRDNYDKEAYSAFLSGELGEMLIKRKDIRRRREKIMAIPNEKCIFDAEYWGKMLIYLIENNIIDPKNL